MSYDSIHQRVRRERGRAAEHRCVDCGKQAVHWSYDGADENEIVDTMGRRYSRLIEHYLPRCGGCHRRYDHAPDVRRAVAAAGGRARGTSMTSEERSKLGKAGAAALHSVPGLAKRLAAKWPDATDEERAAARAILAELD